MTSSIDYLAEGFLDDDDGIAAPSFKGAKNLGGKTIGLFGSIVLGVNNLVGPGVLALPRIVQRGGLLVTLIIITLVTIIASLSSTLLCEASSMIPGNRKYDNRKEFSTIVEFYFGKRWYYVTQVLYNATLTTMNIPQILVTAQVMDAFFIFAFTKSYAFSFTHFEFVAAEAHQLKHALDVPFSHDGVVITLGYLVVLILCLPIGFMNLNDAMWFQYVSFALLITILGEFLVQFWLNGLQFDRVPLSGELSDNGQSLGVIFFSYLFVVTIPSWVNEKKDSVNVNVAVWSSTLLSTAIYLIIGLFGAWAYSAEQLADGDILGVMTQPRSPLITKLSSYIFSIGVVGLGIPLYSIMIRYNLFVGGVCGNKMASFWGVVFPWIISWLLYQGTGFTDFVNWSSLFVSGFINFALPVAVYIKAKRMSKFTEATPINESAWVSSKGSVFPTPKRVNPVTTAWAVLVTVILMIAANIALALYYLIAHHEDIVDG